MLLLLLITPVAALASFIDHDKKEINVKIVYFGPGTEAGAENLRYIYSKTESFTRDPKIVELGTTDRDRVLFFSFVPQSLGEIRGFKIRFHLYTAAVRDDAAEYRQLVLKGADGIVFVAEGGAGAEQRNRASLEQLTGFLKAHQFDRSTEPFVFQLARPAGLKNPTAVDAAEALGLRAVPAFEADVKTGAGVFDTLKGVAKLVLLAMKSDTAQARSSDANPRSQGRGYSLPIVAGFAEEKSGTVQTQTRRANYPDAILASIMVTSIVKLDEDPRNPKVCEAMAKKTASQLGNKLESAEVVPLGNQKSCTWGLADPKNPNRISFGWVMQGPSNWLLTCSTDQRDLLAAGACASAAAGWRFEAD